MSQSLRGASWWFAALSVGALAFATRLTALLGGGRLSSVGGYDDGVYYTAADALVHGRLPYRDFLLLHPPGIVLVLAPFAWVGSLTSDAQGFAGARVGFMVLGAVNTVLVMRLLRRFGMAAVLAGGVFYALFYPAVYAERSTLLEALGTSAVLAALLLLGSGGQDMPRWRTYAAGAALGAGVSVKIWYVVSLAVILGAATGRSRLRVTAGAVAAAAAICLPFFAAAPTTMFRFVLTDQLGRVRSAVSVIERLESILSVDHLSAADSSRSSAIRLLLVLAVLAVGCCVLLALTERAAWVFVALLAAHTVLLMLSPSYFGHYATMTAAPLALVVGVAAGRVVPALGRRWPGRIVLGVVAAAVVVVLAGVVLRNPIGARFPAEALRPATTAVNGCVMADDPTALVVLDVLSSDLRRGCEVWPDVTGWTYDEKAKRRVAGRTVARARNVVWQRLVMGYLYSGAAVIAVRADTGLSKASRARIDALPVLARAGKYALHSTTPAGGKP